jgi:hypothetical protein
MILFVRLKAESGILDPGPELGVCGGQGGTCLAMER